MQDKVQAALGVLDMFFLNQCGDAFPSEQRAWETLRPAVSVPTAHNTQIMPCCDCARLSVCRERDFHCNLYVPKVS